MNIARHAMATLLLPFLSLSLLRSTSFFRIDSQTFLPFRIHRIVNFTERERSRKGWYRGINAGLNYHFTNRRVIIGFITGLYGVLSLAQVFPPVPSPPLSLSDESNRVVVVVGTPNGTLVNTFH